MGGVSEKAQPTAPTHVSEDVALRLRHIELQRLAQENKTRCDRCEQPIPRGEALESWIGDRCAYVVCMSCLAKESLHVSRYPGGIAFDATGESSHGCIRSARNTFPSAHRPRHPHREHP